MTAAHNSNYKLVLEHGGHRFYMPTETTAYHKSRELAMAGQDTFSRAGIDPETLREFAQLLLDKANKVTNDATLRTDVGVVATNLLLRLREPIDELCAIRMGAIACIHEDEDPDKCTQSWIQRKIQLAKEHPAIFDFFLQMGIAFTPEYVNLLRGLEAEEYLLRRNRQIELLTPITQ
jgi:hypothetical protein